MFNKKLDNEILNELKALNDKMQQNNKLLQEIWDNVRGVKRNTGVLLNINSEVNDLNIVAQSLLDSKKLNEIKDKLCELKYPYSLLYKKPEELVYLMNPDEENNDLLNKGKYKSKYNIIIKSNNINLKDVDWDKSYLMIDYNGMSNYQLMLKQNGRSFSKYSDIKENVELLRFDKLVLCLSDKYISIDLDLYKWDSGFDIIDSDRGETWFYEKVVIDLDK